VLIESGASRGAGRLLRRPPTRMASAWRPAARMRSQRPPRKFFSRIALYYIVITGAWCARVAIFAARRADRRRLAQRVVRRGNGDGARLGQERGRRPASRPGHARGDGRARDDLSDARALPVAWIYTMTAGPSADTSSRSCQLLIMLPVVGRGDPRHGEVTASPSRSALGRNRGGRSLPQLARRQQDAVYVFLATGWAWRPPWICRSRSCCRCCSTS